MKTTRWIAILLTISMIVTGISVCVSAEENTSGVVDARSGEFFWEFSDGTLYLTGEGYCIDECPWEHLKDQIEAIVFDGSLSILNKTFTEMPNLKSIIWPDELHSISDAFDFCINLETVEIPSTVQYIDFSFSSCKQLRSVMLSANLDSMDRSFGGCTCLTQITIPSKVKSISGSFSSSGLVNLTIPKNVERLSNGAFDGCTYLREICFLGNAPELSDGAFENVNATVYYAKNNSTWKESVRSEWSETLTWKGVDKPANVKMTYDPYWTLSGQVLTITGSGELVETPWIRANNIIKKIVIEEGITNIPEDAFYGTEILKEVDLPYSLERIGVQAFERSAISSLDIPPNVEEIGAWAFSDCINLTHISLPSGVIELGDHSFYRCSSLNEISFSDGLIRIGANAFQDCKQLSLVKIPSTVSSIMKAAFSNCTELKEIHFDGNAPQIGNSAFSNVSATVYYHADKEGWTDEVMQDYGGDLTWTPYHTHSYTSKVTAPTCTEDGYTTHTCSECGDVKVDTYVDALGHSYGEPEFIGKDEGHSYTCTRCGSMKIESCTFDTGSVAKEATLDKFGTKKHSCTVCGGSYETEFVYRISGKGRCETAYAAADLLKEKLGIEKFDAIIIASGTNFADALAGSFLAAEKDAPILLFQKGYEDENLAYITENLASGGKVYILGGSAAVPESMVEALADFDVERLSGKSRFDTNLKILEEGGVTGQEILISTGWNFADCLSASATGLPILMVDNKGGKLTDGQIDFLKAHADNTYTVIGGSAAVSEELKAAIETVVGSELNRLSGKTREATSVKVAKTYFTNPDYALLAYSRNFPDGLCGGPLAHAMGAPLLLIDKKYESAPAEYIAANGIEKGAILGGSAAVSDDTGRIAFGLN